MLHPTQLTFIAVLDFPIFEEFEPKEFRDTRMAAATPRWLSDVRCRDDAPSQVGVSAEEHWLSVENSVAFFEGYTSFASSAMHSIICPRNQAATSAGALWSFGLINSEAEKGT